MTRPAPDYEILGPHWHAARQAFEQGNPAACLEHLEPLLAACGPLPDWLILKSQTLLALGHADAALITARIGLQTQPRSAGLWASAAVAWINLGVRPAAFACLYVAEALDAELPGLAVFQARIRELGGGEEAVLPQDWQDLVEASRRAPRLGACLIVRDESAVLDACLQSLSGFDEITVIDTGSTDDTVAIAERHGAVVGHATWTDDFAAARNVSLERSTADWVLVIDADERLIGGHEAVRASIDRQGFAGVVLCPVIDNEDPDDGHATLHRGARLFARTPGRHYEGIIHEQVCESSGAEPLNWQIDGWSLYHVGYANQVRQHRRKSHRNAQLLARWQAASPDDPKPYYYMGLEARSQGRPAEAARQFEMAEGLSPPLALRCVIRVQLISAWSEMADHARIVELAPAMAGDIGQMPDYWLYMGAAFANLGRFAEAEAAYRKALDLPSDMIGALESRGARSWRPLVSLAELQGLKGDWEGTLTTLAPHLANAGMLASVHRLYVRALVMVGREGEAKAHLAHLLDRPNVSSRLATDLAYTLGTCGPLGERLMAHFQDWQGGLPVIADRLREAQRWTDLLALGRKWGGDLPARVHLQIGVAHHALGDLPAAGDSFEKARQTDPGLAEAWHNLGALALSRGDLDQAEHLLHEALQQDPTALVTRIDLAKVAYNRQDREGARHWLQEADQVAPGHPVVRRMLASLAGAR
jgi:tetratricopeptide (TPR) repeat protein